MQTNIRKGRLIVKIEICRTLGLDVDAEKFEALLLFLMSTDWEMQDISWDIVLLYESNKTICEYMEWVEEMDC